MCVAPPPPVTSGAVMLARTNEPLGSPARVTTSSGLPGPSKSLEMKRMNAVVASLPLIATETVLLPARTWSRMYCVRSKA